MQENYLKHLRRSGNLQYAAKLIKSPLFPYKKMQHLSFAGETMIWDDQWLQVIFSDEKEIGTQIVLMAGNITSKI